MDDEELDALVEQSRAPGTCLLVALAAGAMAALFALAPVAGTLIIWGGSAVWLWWVVSRPNKIDNPSPPPPDTSSETGKPQFSVVPDPDNPARHLVVWHNEKES